MKFLEMMVYFATQCTKFKLENVVVLKILISDHYSHITTHFLLEMITYLYSIKSMPFVYVMLICLVVSVCQDTCVNQYGNDSVCNDWAAKGICQINTTFMQGQCYKACNPDCGTTTTSSTTVTITTVPTTTVTVTTTTPGN